MANEINLGKKVNAAVISDTPAVIWGSPGIGKTATVHDVGNALNMIVHPLIASIYEPTYFAGYPFVKDGVIATSKPGFISDLEAYNGKNVIVFLDELPTTPRATQNVLLRLVLERKVGPWELPKNVHIVAAGNFVDVAGNTILSSAMANRFLHIMHVPQVDEWLNSLNNNVEVRFNYSPKWKDEITLYHSYVVDFAETYQKVEKDFFNAAPSNPTEPSEYAFATPRSLTAAAKLIALTIEEPALCKELVKGQVGQVAGTKLLSHINSLNKLEKFTEIDLKNYKFSKDPSQVSALIRSAAMYANEEKYVEKAVEFMRMSHSAGFQPAVMKYSSIFSKNVVSSGHPKYSKGSTLIRDLPFIVDIIAAELHK